MTDRQKMEETAILLNRAVAEARLANPSVEEAAYLDSLAAAANRYDPTVVVGGPSKGALPMTERKLVPIIARCRRCGRGFITMPRDGRDHFCLGANGRICGGEVDEIAALGEGAGDKK